MKTDVQIQVKPFQELTLVELHACLRLRGEVFVVEQRICTEADPDEDDPRCQHVLLWKGQVLVGTARLLPIVDGKVIKVGRVAVHRDHRGIGLGGELLRQVGAWITEMPGRAGRMHAQAYLEEWYSALGWRREGERFNEAGIEHIRMVYPSV